jgi:DNA processing protein
VTVDQAVALSLLPGLSRVSLTERLRADDPELLDRASSLLDRARELRTRCAARGVHVLAWSDPLFPAALLAIPDAPPALWYRGDLAALQRPAVAIVGSRAASAVALETAARLATDLAARGIVVVSGLARGVDSAAHRGALQTGRTIAVLGSGLERIYPAEHKGLAAEIAHDGIVFSEYAAATAPQPFFFPQRNRLISGLSRAVVVIEASDKSGSLITAGCALEQGRDVMAVPGNVLSGRNRGGHALIRDGARIVECADDVVEELGLVALPAPTAGEGRPSDRTSANSTDPILGAIEVGQPCDIDALVSACGLDAARLLPRLLDLELKGLVRRVAGGRFVRST